MNKQVRIFLSLVLCFVFVGALGSAPSAKASPVIPPQPQEYLSVKGDAITIKATDRDKAASKAMTLEARQAAMSKDLISFKSSDLNAMSNYSGDGAPGFKDGRLPDPAALAKAQAEFSNGSKEMNKLPMVQSPNSMETFGTKNTYTGYLGNYFTPFYLYYPYAAVGKLYFTDGYNNYSCTASLIDHDNIVTAAHCVYDTDYNYWYYGFVFVPAEANYNAPFGTFSYYSATIMTNWAKAKKSSAGLGWDVAVLSLYGDPGYSSGWLGYSWNWNAKQLSHAIGYPSNITGGYYTYICVAESFQKGNGLGMGCNMTYGSSGGPWIIWFIPYQDSYPYSTSGNWVNAVVSGGTPGTPTFYGPKFTNKNFLPLCAYEGC
jgi:V8-like Glu-specific endopeptidase